VNFATITLCVASQYENPSFHHKNQLIKKIFWSWWGELCAGTWTQGHDTISLVRRIFGP
jgi:hypothetical protein